MTIDRDDGSHRFDTGETHPYRILPDGGENEGDGEEDDAERTADEDQNEGSEREQEGEDSEADSEPGEESGREDEEPEEGDQNEAEAGDEEEEETGKEDEEAGELTVTVESESGEYVRGATVTIEDKDGGAFESGERQATGTDGEASFLIDEGDYIVTAATEEGSAEEQLVVEGDEAATLTIVPDEERYDLTVSVRNESGDSVSGASITVESEDMGVIEGFQERPSEAESDENGRASFELVEGQYTVTVETDGETNDQAVEIEGDDEETTLTLDVEEEEAQGEENGRQGPKEAEGRVDEEESASHGTTRGSTVLYLDLEGLFLDLLGLEVDLHEVVLDVRAITGSGKLLGNLLSGVANLLSPLSSLLNRLLNTVTNLLSYLTSPLKSLWNQIKKPFKWARRVGTRIANALSAPIEWTKSAASRTWSVLTAPFRWLRDAVSGGVGSGGVLPSLPESTAERWQRIKERLPSLPSSPSLPSLPLLPSLPSPSNLLFGVVNSVLDGILSLLGGDSPDEESEESDESTDDESDDERGDDGEGSETEDEESESGGIRSRVSSALPDENRLIQGATGVLGELSGDDQDSSPSATGQRAGEMVGRRLGQMVSRALGGTNDDEGSEQ